MFQTNKRIFFQDEHLPRHFRALVREVLPYFHFQSTFWLFALSRQDSRPQHPRSPSLGLLAHYHHVTCGTYSSLQLKHTLQKERQGQSPRFSKWRLFPLRKKETKKTRSVRLVLRECFTQNGLLISSMLFLFYQISLKVVKLISAYLT